jgi:hypothetical protein
MGYPIQWNSSFCQNTTYIETVLSRYLFLLTCILNLLNEDDPICVINKKEFLYARACSLLLNNLLVLFQIFAFEQSKISRSQFHFYKFNTLSNILKIRMIWRKSFLFDFECFFVKRKCFRVLSHVVIYRVSHFDFRETALKAFFSM